jgi:hypothetical protein
MGTVTMMMGSDNMKTKSKKKKPVSAYSKATEQMNRQVNHAVNRVHSLQELYTEMMRERKKNS